VDFKYGLDDKPPFGENVLLGLQWLFIAIPSIVIIVKILGSLHFITPLNQGLYLQKIFFVISLTLFFQVLLGHRLPLVAGPATVLLIGVIASRGFAVEAIHTSIMVGGLILALVSLAGLFGYLRRLFTPRVVAAVLLLIAFTLMPTVMNLITKPGGTTSPLPKILFAFALTLGMVYFQKILKGIWKSTLIVWAMLIGSMAHYLIFSAEPTVESNPGLAVFSFFFKQFNLGLTIEPGVLISFLFCFLALSINDLGSLESMEELLKPSQMPQRINRGITFTGIANVLAGFFGVIGPVNYSLSPGVILSTGCASRYTLVPASILLFILSFVPSATGVIENIPSVVIGSVFIFILCFQVAAGLSVIGKSEGASQIETGIVVGMPLLLGTIIAILPVGIIETFPVTLRPVMGNGFVIGVFTAFILEHLIFRGKRAAP
jgi:xanthine/uracil permease